MIINISTLFGLFSLVLLQQYASSENSVRLKSKYGQLITSSTLKWVSRNGGKLPENTVVGSVEFLADEGDQNDLQPFGINKKPETKKNEIYICRALHNGAWIPGGLHEDREDKCTVSFIGKVYEYERYEVLQNVDNAARLVWSDWQDDEVPAGAVSCGADIYIAHRASPKFKLIDNNYPIGTSFLIGKVDVKEGLFGRISVINEDKQEESGLRDGQILIEIEPIKYELTVTKLQESKKKVSKKTVQLGEATLQNPGNISRMTVDTVVAYKWDYVSNWGQGKAMLKGLLTTINFDKPPFVEEIKWGISSTKSTDGLEKIETALDPGVGVHVTVMGNSSNVDIPYSGTLVSIFGDNTITSRTIQGTWHQTAMLDITQHFGPLYYIQNLTQVPTTTTTTTTTTTVAPTTIKQEATLAPSSFVPASSAPATTIIGQQQTMLTPSEIKAPDDSKKDEGMIGDEALHMKKNETGTAAAGSSTARLTLNNSTIISTLLLVASINAIIRKIT